MMQITEDTPPDMLAGAMDLTVHLPNGKSVKTSVERSTPMMDLLVQITTANHLQLSNHTLQVLGMAPSSQYTDRVLPFKPNTPIGTLDTQHIRVLPKGKTIPQPKVNVAPGHQPFESTFRLKVHLPRNQLYVTRVSRNVLLEDIMKKVCEEKNLDPLKYDFKRPGNLEEVLDPKLTLNDYQITEIYVVSKRLSNLNQAFSPADIMVLRREEERKQMHNKSGGGVLNLIFKKVKPSMGSGSVSSNDNRSLSPTHSDDSRSVTPPTVPPLKKDPPRPPQRKRRPAPKPPQLTPQISVNSDNEKTAPSSVVSTNEEEEQKKPVESNNGLTICHSRNSSDSSGYHEASILSEHAASLGRNRPKSAFVGDLPSNLTEMAGQSRSTTSLIGGRKKKAAPPPPPVAAVSPANSVIAPPSPPLLVASQPDTRPTSETTLPLSPLEGDAPALLQSSSSKSLSEEKSLESTDSGIAQDREKEPDDDSGFRTPPPPPVLDDASFILHDTESSVTTPVEKPAETVEKVPPPPKSITDMDDWHYQLPSPPKAFRDSSPPILNSNYSASESDFKDSVVTSPELFEKLRNLEDRESASSEEPPLNTLSLEHLEKRKSLVYNRELATSFKMTDNADPKPKYTQHTLPNFKITTYDVPKHQNIKVFEDDTVRSNENVTFRNKPKVPVEIKNSNGLGTVVSRSGSFSTESSWSPMKPVSRSKSTLTLNKCQPPKEVNGNGVISRSNSLFDVSGLHSLEVMKQIRTKLHSPNGSSEDLKTTQKPEPVSPPDLSPIEPKPPSPQAVKKYYYRGPPAVNMSTWSERPKKPVAVKEDEDYKLGNVNNQKTEITQNSGNVVIKIGAAATSTPISNNVTSTTKLLAPAGYRKPLSNINGAPQRPGFFNFEPNRAPVVRGVEFKKPFRDFQMHNNTSVVHLNSEDVTLRPKNSGSREVVNKRASWAGSYSTLPTKPKVESHQTYEPNQKVPFSQSTLRRTESNKLYAADQNSNVFIEKNNNNTIIKKRQQCLENNTPPPPPQMPKVTLRKVVQLENRQSNGSEDPRNQLMESIRSFGGKKGLKAIKT